MLMLRVPGPFISSANSFHGAKTREACQRHKQCLTIDVTGCCYWVATCPAGEVLARWTKVLPSCERSVSLVPKYNCTFIVGRDGAPPCRSKANLTFGDRLRGRAGAANMVPDGAFYLSG
eukprot:scaffold13154_cov27-Tisochrysis_lutea.AAC.1